MKIAIVGNGSISCFLASRLINDNEDITIFGPRGRGFGASAAAGLMLNIFSEVDAISSELPITQWKLKYWSRAIDAWGDFFGERGIVSKNSLFTSPKTIVYRDNQGANELEDRSFDTQKYLSKKYSVSGIQNSCINELPHEPSADARHVLASLDHFLFGRVTLVDNTVKMIKKVEDGITVIDADNKEYGGFDKVVIAAGSASSQILERSDSLIKPKIRCFNGVGSAVLAFSEEAHIESPSTDYIRRSPNRGGTCGLHLVQCINGIYIGASSLVTTRNLKYARFGSVEMLVNGAEKELGLKDMVRQSIRLLTGYRPVSGDATPLVGYIDDDVFVAYGHKRDGFTWAPFLSSLIQGCLKQTNPVDIAHGEYLQMCTPLREGHSFGDKEIAKELYLLNEMYSAAQHDEKFDEVTKSQREARFEAVHAHGRFKDSVCHPELINVHYFNLVASKK